MENSDIYSQNTGNQPGEPVRMDIRVEDPLEKGIISKGQGFLPLAEIQETTKHFSWSILRQREILNG